MRSISSSGSSATPIANTMTTNLISNYPSATYLNLNSSSAATTSSANDWESLRKQARQLENEIDSKLVGFSKLSSNFTVSSISNNKTPNSTPSTPTSTTAGSSDLLFVTLSKEIEDALARLTILNGKMSDCLNSESMSNANGVVHTLQRHRDILRDYSHEYEKTKRNIISFKEREKLLASTSFRANESNLNNRRSDSASSSNGNNSTSLYMKEYDHLKNSHALIDQQLETAEHTKENLQSQRQSLRLIQQKMNTLAHKFPLINNLVQKIKFKKRKDSIILGTVISVCLILMLLYVF